MNEQLKKLIQAREFVRFRVRMNDDSVYAVASREHAWLGAGRAGFLFVETDPGAASMLQIRSIVAVETEAQAQQLSRSETQIIFSLAASRSAPNVAGRPVIWHQNGTFGV